MHLTAIAGVGMASLAGLFREAGYRVTGSEGDLRVEASTVHAFVNRSTMRPIPIPEPLRAILLRHLIREPAPNLAT